MRPRASEWTMSQSQHGQGFIDGSLKAVSQSKDEDGGLKTPMPLLCRTWNSFRHVRRKLPWGLLKLKR